MAAGDMSDHSGVIEVTAPTGGYTKGSIYQLASGGYAVALETIAATATGLVALITSGKKYEVTATGGTGEGATQGGPVYVTSGGAADANATGNTFLVGVVWAEDKDATATTGFITKCATAAS